MQNRYSTFCQRKRSLCPGGKSASLRMKQPYPGLEPGASALGGPRATITPAGPFLHF